LLLRHSTESKRKLHHKKKEKEFKTAHDGWLF
jgi:hypothetical protein